MMLESGFWLTHEADSMFVGHQFGGPHDIPGAQCDRCRRVLHRIVSLATDDPRLGIGGIGLSYVHLFACFVCLPAVRSYRLREDGGIELLDHAEEFADWEPWEDYPAAFPSQPIALVPVTDAEQEIIVRANELGRESQVLQDEYPDVCAPRHQIGGIPFLTQPYERPDCPICSLPQVLTAAISDENGTPTGWTDNDGLQYVFHLCPTCRVVTTEVFSD